MSQFFSLFSNMPSWVGVVLLVVFALSGRLFRDNWKQQKPGWKKRSWVFGLISLISFCVLVFGSYNFHWAS